MSRLFFLTGWFIFATSLFLYGQDTIPDTVLVEQEIEIFSVKDTGEIDQFATDKLINEGFSQFGDPITDLVFYAPTIGEDILIQEVGVKRSSDDFFENPPFEVEYKGNESPSYDVPFYVFQDSETGQLSLSYRTERKIPLGKKVSLEGRSIKVEKDGTDIEKGEIYLSIELEGDPRILEDAKFQTLPLERDQSPEETDSILVSYLGVVPIGPDGKISVEGFDFTITSKESSSNYSFSEGKTYSFQINQIKFLPIVVIVLILGATFFTVYFGFVNFSKFGLAIDVVRGKYSDPNEEGEVSHFQALTAALSGTVGLGNIAGVAIAISIGGAGATFWMILAGLIGMSSKFTECTLGVKYRTIDKKGQVSGGPMYYLSKGLEEKGLKTLGKIFAVFFAVMAIGGSFGGGNMVQVNQAYQQFADLGLVSMDGWVFGLIIAALVAVVIIGGIKSIANVTDKIVPFMVGVYMIAALIIIFMNVSEVPRVISEIFYGAFAPTAVAGGFIGVLIQGFRRAAFSNEAGVGSASIAHSAVKTNNPASEGIVALLEPFIDTVVVCTMTAFVIVITDNHVGAGGADGVTLTSQAFSGEIPMFNYVLAVAVILFAFSTMITWSYYGLKAWTYLFGGSQVADISYKVLFCAFVVIGAASTMESVFGFSDAMIFAMAFPNIIGLVILSPVVRVELDKYIGKIRSGEIIRVK